MAELVDALVSNTCGFTSMPVRSRLWVLQNRLYSIKVNSRFFIYKFNINNMKKNDIIFIICAVLFFAPFFFSNSVYGWFISATNTHPYLMSFAKFAILSTAGECIGLRIKTGNYSSKGFGVIPRGITWGFLGVLISAAMTIFSNGVPAFLNTLVNCFI